MPALRSVPGGGTIAGFWLYEVYQDDAAMAAHAKSPSLPKLRENIPTWVEERMLVKTSLIYPETA